MIWITTLCLLALGGWFLFNALNERRWVQAHSHDESVASDTGLFGGFSAATGTGSVGSDEKVSIDQENSGFARAVVKVQEKTNKLGEKFFESKAAAARVDDAERPGSVADENTFFGRAVARVSEKTGSMGQRLDEKMKAASGAISTSASGEGSKESLLERASRKVSEKSDEISHKVANRAKNMSDSYGSARSASEEDGMFGKMVKTVSGGIDKVESKVDAKLSSAKRDDGEDIVSRVASKVGSKINELGSKKMPAKADSEISTDKVD